MVGRVEQGVSDRLPGGGGGGRGLGDGSGRGHGGGNGRGSVGKGRGGNDKSGLERRVVDPPTMEEDRWGCHCCRGVALDETSCESNQSCAVTSTVNTWRPDIAACRRSLGSNNIRSPRRKPSRSRELVLIFTNISTAVGSLDVQASNHLCIFG